MMMNNSQAGEQATRVLLAMDGALANLVGVTLRHARYATRVAASDAAAGTALRDWSPQLVLVDIDAQFGTLEIVRRDAHDLPLVGMTRRRSTALKLRAIEAGADDIIEVPFTLDEIVMRPYALLRRVGISTSLAGRIALNRHLEVDLLAQTVTLDGTRRLELTPIQQTLLYILAASANEVLTRETLLATIWGDEFQIESNVVDRHIRELRVKLGDEWRNAKYIETIAGRGYRFKLNPVPSPELVGAHESAQ